MKNLKIVNKSMLLLGDIHCTSSVVDEIIENLQDYIDKHPQEKNLFFLGDYVYHFSYDRKALFTLFRFFVHLAKSGKHVYVLAGNHDRISGHFVFSEGQFLLDSLDTSTGEGALQFITKPQILEIEGYPIVCMPYTKSLQPDGASEEVLFDKEFASLEASENANEQRSGRANSVLKHLIATAKEDYPDKKVHVMHHWYINKIAFPGQVAKFSYRSPALSERWLEDDEITLFSGHLHQPFTYKNYCCVGAVWFTSPLETNQVKYLFQYDFSSLSAEEVWIRPYVTVEYSDEDSVETLGLEHITQQITENRTKAQKTMQSDNFDVTIATKTFLKHAISLYIAASNNDFRTLDQYCDQELVEKMRDIKIKSQRRSMGELLSSLEDASLSLDSSIADWKTLLNRFLEARYGENETKNYEEILQELDIL